MKLGIGLALALLALPAVAQEPDKRCFAGDQFAAAGAPVLAFWQKKDGYERGEVSVLIKRDGWSVRDGDEVDLPVKFYSHTFSFKGDGAIGIDDGAIVTWISDDDFKTLVRSSSVQISIGDDVVANFQLSSLDLIDMESCRMDWHKEKNAAERAARMAEPVVDPFKK